MSPAAGTVCWRKLQTTRHHTSEGLSPAVASASGPAVASASDEVVDVFEHKGKFFMLYNGNGFGKTGFGMAVWQE